MPFVESGIIGLIVTIVIILIVLIIFLSMVPLRLWISAMASGVRIGLGTLVGMRIRRINPERVVLPLIKGTKAGLDVSINGLETHLLAGGNVDRVVNALIAAQRAGIPLEFSSATAIDLAGRDVLMAVQMSVNPKVIETPVVAAIAKDGIELRAKARVTVRANIDRLVGGAGEETIIARVGEGIVTTVGSAATHKEVLENPDLISRTVLSKGLDAGTAFEILSIDIADVDVGRTVGAQLQMDQAEADRRIAQAKAEYAAQYAQYQRLYQKHARDAAKRGAYDLQYAYLLRALGYGHHHRICYAYRAHEHRHRTYCAQHALYLARLSADRFKHIVEGIYRKAAVAYQLCYPLHVLNVFHLYPYQLICRTVFLFLRKQHFILPCAKIVRVCVYQFVQPVKIHEGGS